MLKIVYINTKWTFRKLIQRSGNIDGWNQLYGKLNFSMAHLQIQASRVIMNFVDNVCHFNISWIVSTSPHCTLKIVITNNIDNSLWDTCRFPYEIRPLLDQSNAENASLKLTRLSSFLVTDRRGLLGMIT